MPGIALPATTGLWCVVGFLGLAGLAVVVGGRRIATPLIYGGTLAVALVALGAALTCFLDSGPPWTLVLPIGLPGIGARFRVDALSAFFLVVVNLGAADHEPLRARLWPPRGGAGAGASVLCRLSRRHEPRGVCRRRLHVPAGVGIHVAHLVGDRAGAPRRSRRTAAPAFIYLVMASFGTLCLLLAFGLLAGPAGGYAFETMRAATFARRHGDARGAARADGRRIEGRPGAAPCVAAARPSGRAQSRLGAAERGDDQGRRLRLRAHRVRPRRPAQSVVRARGPDARRHHRRHRRSLRPDAARSQAAAGLPYGGEHRHHLHRARPRARLPRQRHECRRPRLR